MSKSEGFHSILTHHGDEGVLPDTCCLGVGGILRAWGAPVPSQEAKDIPSMLAREVERCAGLPWTEKEEEEEVEWNDMEAGPHQNSPRLSRPMSGGRLPARMASSVCVLPGGALLMEPPCHTNGKGAATILGFALGRAGSRRRGEHA